MKTANGYLRIACLAFNVLLLFYLFKKKALDLCSTILSQIRSGILSIFNWFGKSLRSCDFHFLHGLDLSALSMGSGVFVVELVIDMNGTPTSVKRKLVYIKK